MPKRGVYYLYSYFFAIVVLLVYCFKLFTAIIAIQLTKTRTIK